MSLDQTPRVPACPLCRSDGGTLLLRKPRWRIVLADDSDHPAFTRVVWNAHVAEMSDLGGDERLELLEVVLEVESVLRSVLSPEKINLASLGNQVPHLHWHVVPRWRDDRHFPGSVWSAPAAHGEAAAAARARAVRARLGDYVNALHERLDRRG